MAQLEKAPSQSSVDAIKRELRVLKKLQYNSADGEEGDPEVVENDLESVLLSRVKGVEAELLKSKRDLTEQAQRASSAGEKLNAAEAERENLIRLVEKLESDLVAQTQNMNAKKEGLRQGDVMQVSQAARGLAHTPCAAPCLPPSSRFSNTRFRRAFWVPRAPHRTRLSPASPPLPPPVLAAGA